MTHKKKCTNKLKIVSLDRSTRFRTTVKIPKNDQYNNNRILIRNW